jgi:predicted neuraminidase
VSPAATETAVLDLKARVAGGVLFHPPDDAGRADAFIPSLGDEDHAPSLAFLANGDLLCVWFAGSAEGAGDVSIGMARLPAGASRWDEPRFVTESRDRSEQNPSLFAAPDGELWLLFTSQATRGMPRAEWDRRKAAGEVEGLYPMQWTSEIRRRVSTDDGRTWGPVETFVERPGSFCRHPPLVLDDGAWLHPMYYSLEAGGRHGDDHSVVRISEDSGATWAEHPIPRSKGRVHPSIVDLGGSELVAFFRSRAADRIYASRSADNGRTWTEPERTPLPNNNASIQAAGLRSGRIAMVFNHFSANDDPDTPVWPTRRYPLTIALSEDGGRTWPHMRHIDPGDGFFGSENEPLNRVCAYPSLVQGPDDAIDVAYSYRGRQCIKHVRVTEDWIRDEVDWVDRAHVSHAHPF